MRAVDFIRMSLDASFAVTMGLIDDMKDAPLTFPTARGGNHPLWVLGHLAWSEAEVIQHQMLGEPNPLAHWRELFGVGSEPVADASRYPAFDELRAAYEGARAKTLEVLGGLTDEDLDRPTHAAQTQEKPLFKTYAQCFMVASFNAMIHRGQVADARRSLGRTRLRM